MKRVSFALLFLVACKPAAAPDQPSHSDALPSGSGGPDATVTAAECADAGGSVVGDIGDGAIFKPDYVCQSSGEPPTARIVAEEGGPLGVEGSVCCGG